MAKTIPNTRRAIISGKIATIYKGQRIVREYTSGEPLKGFIPVSDAPPYTGFVREGHRHG